MSSPSPPNPSGAGERRAGNVFRSGEQVAPGAPEPGDPQAYHGEVSSVGRCGYLLLPIPCLRFWGLSCDSPLPATGAPNSPRGDREMKDRFLSPGHLARPAASRGVRGGVAPSSTRPVLVGDGRCRYAEPRKVSPSGPVVAATVTNAVELTNALRTGGAIRIAPGRYMGNFVIGVDGTSLLGRGDLPDRRVAPADVSGVVLAPFDPLVPPLRVIGESRERDRHHRRQRRVGPRDRRGRVALRPPTLFSNPMT